MLLRHKIFLGSAIMTLAQLAHAQASTITPEPATPAPPTAAPPDSTPMPGVTAPDTQAVPPTAPQTQDVQPGAQQGAIVTPERTVTIERRAQTETDTDPYIQRRIARHEARQDYKAAKQEAKQEYRQAKREADERFNEMRQAEVTQSPRGELGADHMGNDYYGSTGR